MNKTARGERTHKIGFSLTHLYHTAIKAVFSENIESFEYPYDISAIGGLDELAMEIY